MGVAMEAAEIQRDRGAMVRAKVFMNHTTAWEMQEFDSCESGRLAAVVVRLMYLQSLAEPGEPRTVYCGAEQPEQLREAVSAACRIMEREVVNEASCARGIVAHIPPAAESVEAMSRVVENAKESPSAVLYL